MIYKIRNQIKILVKIKIMRISNNNNKVTIEKINKAWNKQLNSRDLIHLN